MKKISRRILALVLTVIMTVALTAFSVASASAERAPYIYSGIRDELKNYDEVFFRLYDNVMVGAEVVDISTFRVRHEYLITLFDDLLSSSPELYYLNSRLTYSYSTINGIEYVAKVRFHYNMTPRELKEARPTYDSEVEYIASLVDPSMSETEKALFVYDYMAALYEYDSDLIVYDAYRMMTGERGVCRAYSLAYAAVMRELGMECIMVVSNEMVHAWNLVRVDGVWYHVDLTFDDPLNDRPGRTMHDYFLLSDEEIESREKGAHYGWRTNLVCDQSYSGEKFWENTTARTVYIGENRYTIDTPSGTLIETSPSGNTREIYKFVNKWYTGEIKKNSWVGNFSGLSVYDGKLIINTNEKILAIDPESGKVTEIFTVLENEQIMGTVVHKDEIKYYLTFNPGGGDGATVQRVTITDEMMQGESVPSLPFTDVAKNSKYYPAIEYVYNNGLFSGVSATRFAPDSDLTRAMFVTVLGRLCNVDTAKYTASTFTDVPEGQWYTAYVGWATENGIVNGVGNGKFAPNNALTREQMAKIVAYCAIKLTGQNKINATGLSFTDSDSISNWAYDSVKYCIEYGLIDNGGEFRPQSTATRAEAAEIIARLAEMINNK
ncbi:MAG: S-layer homology domain-containing protein [Clostridia bacterium]|nr:S-layer homology domain-containing protein [Clostridia bacterium]